MRVPFLMLCVLFGAVSLVWSQEGVGEKPPQTRAEPQPIGVLDDALPRYVPLEDEVSGTIHVTCSAITGNLVQRWAADFRAIYPRAKVEVKRSEYSMWIAHSISPIRDEFGILHESPETIHRSRSLDRRRGEKSWPVVVGSDKLEIIVHRNNPIEKLHVDQLAWIFSKQGESVEARFEEQRKAQGWEVRRAKPERPAAENLERSQAEILDHPQIEQWNQLRIDPPWALAAAKIHLYGRERTTDDSSFLEIRTVGPPIYLYGAPWYRPRLPRDDVRKVDSAEAMVEAVANDPNGIGYVSRAMDLTGVRAVPVEGARRKGFSRRQQEAPPDPGQFESAALARPVVLWIASSDDEPRTPLQTEFLRYILSREGQSVVRNSSFAPLPAILAAEQLEAALKTPPVERNAAADQFSQDPPFEQVRSSR